MPEPGDLVDRYVIEAAIGEGGMGRVYRALDPRLGRRVALKVLLAEGDAPGHAQAAARMMREARAAAAFTHPNVVAIHDVGEFEGRPFIAMELVNGRTLRGLTGLGASSAEEKLAWLLDVARGLAAAHRAGLVHRDIKPDNVMVTTDGVVKILDFGIARRAESDTTDVDFAAPTAAANLPSLTGEGQSLGTPQYMAPEQLQAQPVDGRCDQFAWGVMAWELFVGTLPWGAARNGAQLVAAVLSTPVRPLSEVVPSVSPAWSDAVARAVTKRREDRFATMDDLVAWLTGKTTQPSPREPGGDSRPLQMPAFVPATEEALVATRTAPVTSAARTSPEGPRVQRRAGWVTPLVGVLLLVAGSAALWFGEKHESHKSTEGAAAAPPPGVSSGAPAAALSPAKTGTKGPSVGLCGKDVKTECAGETTAWCDTNDRVVACCAQDLAAVGVDGVCDCPPGGPPGGVKTACTDPKPDVAPSIPDVIAGLRPGFRACYNAGLNANESLVGKMVLEVQWAPDGSVYRVHIKEGRMASAEVQRCTMEVLRHAQFPPPKGGTGTITVPVSYVQGENAGRRPAASDAK